LRVVHNCAKWKYYRIINALLSFTITSIRTFLCKEAVLKGEKEMPCAVTSYAIEAEAAVYKVGLRNVQVGNRHKLDWSITGNIKM